MTATCVQIEFSLRCSAQGYHSITEGCDAKMAKVPGLAAKWWWLDSQLGRAGGVYWFESRQAAENYVGGPFIAELRQAPFCEDVRARISELLEPLTRATDAALAAARAAAGPGR
jgi:hypothetical protein